MSANLNNCDPHSLFFGMMGIMAAASFANLGSAYGTAKSGVGISSMGVMRPDLIMRCVIPVVMAGILGIYGLIMGIIINSNLGDIKTYSQAKGYAHLSSGITVGLSALAAGLAIGIVGDAGVRAVAQQPRLYVGMILMLIFAEALALYGLIIGLVVSLISVEDACVPYTGRMYCDPHSSLFGYLGITAATIFANAGSAYGTAKAGLGIACTGVMRPDLVMRNIIPVVMAGILGIYGLIMGIIISQSMGDANTYSIAQGYAHLSGGLTVGLSALVAGFAIGIVGEAGVRSVAQQPRMFVAMILILIFAEALALYGLIIALVVSLLKIDDACVPWETS